MTPLSVLPLRIFESIAARVVSPDPSAPSPEGGGAKGGRGVMWGNVEIPSVTAKPDRN